MAITESTQRGRDLTTTTDRMTEHDLLEVVEIERISGLSPWGWDAYYKELQSPDSVMLVAREAGGAAHPGQINGFIVARLLAGELHVNNVAVRPDYRRTGIATQLIDQAFRWARERGSHLAVLEVREGNTAAQALYMCCGFTIHGRRRRYYASPVEDALLMGVSL